ncbi:EF-hand [Macrolepiota fuliginosa MF-IS2]|uniref:EF-hand n=1 Tax=Macrolepiota fuliginosa MF-IS2 TaxID=1400762 RepID=A0A9P5XM01_9AGAR|nr:EF-hand [Macrolepiota fuliginosa MF-IS2]
MYGRNYSQYGSNYGDHRQSYQAPPPAPPPNSYGTPQRPPAWRGPPQPPPGADPQLWQWFNAVDADHSGAITVQELQSALLNGNWTRFDVDTVKMLMSIFDTDRSGTISFTEFAGLWKYISDWQNVFRHFDRDRSGSIEGRELAEALHSFGYKLSSPLLTLIEHKYGEPLVSSEPTNGYGPPPGITFDRFVRACVVVKTLTEAFQRHDTDRDGWVQLNYEQFMTVRSRIFSLFPINLTSLPF